MRAQSSYPLQFGRQGLDRIGLIWRGRFNINDTGAGVNGTGAGAGVDGTGVGVDSTGAGPDGIETEVNGTWAGVDSTGVGVDGIEAEVKKVSRGHGCSRAQMVERGNANVRKIEDSNIWRSDILHTSQSMYNITMHNCLSCCTYQAIVTNPWITMD